MGTMTHDDGGTRIAQELERQGVRFVFTLIGGHISPILVAARRRGLSVIDVRHEATAVFAADAVARLSGVPGVAVVTAGPGVTNTITAVKNAQLAQSPLVLIGGATATILKGRGALQDIDQRALMAPHVKKVFRVRKVRDLVPALAEAFTVARRGVPGPTFIECPVDLLYPEEVVRRWYEKEVGGRSLPERALAWYVGRHLDRVFSGLDRADLEEGGSSEPELPEVSPSTLRRAAAMVSQAQRPVLVVGSQAMSRPERAEAIAAAVEQMGVPVFLAGMARGLLGRDHRLHLRRGRTGALKAADLVVLAGVPLDFRMGYGRSIGGRAQVVSVNLSAGELVKNRRPHLGVVAHPGRFLEQLAWASWIAPERIEPWLGDLRRRDLATGASCLSDCEQVDPLHLCQEIDGIMDGEDSVVVVDGGDFVGTASYIVQPPGPLSWLDPGVFGTLGVGAGFALGARLCRPEADLWLLWGDGSAGYGLIELDTFARHGLGMTAVIGNDASWAQIARDQISILGDDVATALSPAAYHEAACGLGAEGVLIERDEQVTERLGRAAAIARAGRPVVVNALISTTDARAGSISI